MTSFETAIKEPSLTIEEERSAIRDWQEHGDRIALSRLIRSHTRMAWSAARRMTSNRAILEDLVSAGVISMIEAANKFDLSRNVRFNTYASWFIRNAILGALVKANGVVDIPPRVYLDARAGRLDPIQNAYAIAAAEIAITVDTGTGDEGESETVVPCPGQTPEEFVSKQSVQDQVTRLLESAVEKLDPMEQVVIKKRLASDNREDQPNLAIKFTQSKLATIERRAMYRLRQLLQDSGFSLAMLDN